MLNELNFNIGFVDFKKAYNTLINQSIDEISKRKLPPQELDIMEQN